MDFWSNNRYGRKSSVSKHAINTNAFTELDLGDVWKSYYIFARANNEDRVLIRIGTMSFRAGEKFFFATSNAT